MNKPDPHQNQYTITSGRLADSQHDSWISTAVPGMRTECTARILAVRQRRFPGVVTVHQDMSDDSTRRNLRVGKRRGAFRCGLFE